MQSAVMRRLEFGQADEDPQRRNFGQTRRQIDSLIEGTLQGKIGIDAVNVNAREMPGYPNVSFSAARRPGSRGPKFNSCDAVLLQPSRRPAPRLPDFTGVG
jgi:hypothetical protein